MNLKKSWVWGIIAAQALFLLGWAGYHEQVRQHAPVIRLKGRPVDPRDLLRGDYMTLNYEISRVKPVDIPDANNQSDTDVWVALEPNGRYYEAVAASRDCPVPKPGQILVRGNLSYDWRTDQSLVSVQYGIEKYFVPEGKGTPRFLEMEVEVSVSPAHRLYIRRVLLDGKAFP
ncbi:MAG TPA: GDYXXLXY domain-containing protein [Candidatus Didemnitutus sp.]|nr:GDYXXLXY domain-containing protein [Candidatus Didemnitutus sp.]